MMSLNNKLRELFVFPSNGYTKMFIRRIILCLAFFFLFMIILSADFVSDKVAFDVGQVSDRDIIAPRTVSYVDMTKTKKLEAEVLAGVANVYDLDVSVIGKTEESADQVYNGARNVIADKALATPEEKVQKLQQNLAIALPNTVLTDLVSLSGAELTQAEQSTKDILRKYLQRGIRDDDLDAARKQVAVETRKMAENKKVNSVVAGIAEALLKPNFIFNAKETDKRKQAALSSVDPVRETIKKGQVVIRHGDIVTPEQIQAMEELGLSKGQGGETRIFGLAVFVLTILIIFICYIYKFANDIYQNDLQLVLLGLIMLVTLLLGKAAHYYSDFAAPIATGALLTAILVESRVGFFISVALSLFFGVIVEHDLRAVATALIGSIVGVYSVSKMSHGYSLIRAGIWIAAANFLVIGSSGFIEQINNAQVLKEGLQGIVSGIGAAVITTGLLPYLEHTFNITTPLKLLELAQPTHPLLQRLLLDAPGTYHHSVLVGNLAETAAGSIGADSVVVRVGAYYHDIGKIKRPYFFVENQVTNENPHDKIAPSLSTLIVTSHIKDGLDLCREHNLPQVITEIVQQHHGTMLVSYFYKKASENEHSECIVEEDFRYEGPRPQTKEAALIMLADACEAAVRSIGKPNVNRIEATVRKIIRERLHDGQLDECNLTLKDLNVIGDVYVRVLSSMFHTRIEYPDAKELERRRAKNGNNNKQSAGKDEGNFVNGADVDGGIKQGG
jgi:putative nucleotidyltransferase with HDIG domain